MYMCALEIALSVEISGCRVLSFVRKAHMMLLKIENAGLDE